VRRDAKLTFDPVTKDLIQIDMPLGRERYQLKLDAGWVTECSVEDIKRLAGVRTAIFHLYSGLWPNVRGIDQQPISDHRPSDRVLHLWPDLTKSGADPAVAPSPAL